jgi:hypothetical protein
MVILVCEVDMYNREVIWETRAQQGPNSSPSQSTFVPFYLTQNTECPPLMEMQTAVTVGRWEMIVILAVLLV